MPVSQSSELDSCFIGSITEALASGLENELERYRTRPLPAIVPIPGVKGNTGMGMKNVSRSVQKAVGSDILDK